MSTITVVGKRHTLDHTLADAAFSSRPHQIRTLFSIIISTCFPSNPVDLWTKYKDDMTDDILHRMRRTTSNPQLEITVEMHNEALILIEDACLMMANKVLAQLGMISPNRPMYAAFNQEMQRKKQYYCNELSKNLRFKIPKMNDQQKNAYDTIMKAVNDGSGGIYFLDAPGGTGKTFLISLILATIRSQNQIALALASSGIAATLLDSG